MPPFLLIPLPRIAEKMMNRIMWRKLINPRNWNLELKLESFAHQVPGNFQNITPNMPTPNTPLLYRKDNLDGHSSNVCTDDRFFMKKSSF